MVGADASDTSTGASFLEEDQGALDHVDDVLLILNTEADISRSSSRTHLARVENSVKDVTEEAERSPLPGVAVSDEALGQEEHGQQDTLRDKIKKLYTTTPLLPPYLHHSARAEVKLRDEEKVEVHVFCVLTS